MYFWGNIDSNILEDTVMKINLALLFVFIGLSLSAQQYKYVPFPDSNAVWGEKYWESESAAVFHQYALFKKDTLVNGISYHQLFHNSNSSTIIPANSKSVVGIREDDQKRVWAVNFNEPVVNTYHQNEKGEVMLFDFSLQIGDTIRATDHANIGAADFLVVEDIDSIQIHQSIRKVFLFKTYKWIKWIEGIGNIQGLFFPYGDLTTGGNNNVLICMHQNDTLMYKNEFYDSCIPQFVIDDVALLPNTAIRVYPNPVKNGKVYFDKLDFETLELFDSSGKLLMLNSITGTDCYELDVTHFQKGIYYYFLKTKGLVPTKGKLVIQ